MKTLYAAARMLILTSLVLLPVAGCFVGYPFGSPVQAESGKKPGPVPRKLGSKISLDLQEKAKRSPKSSTSVIIQTASVPTYGFLTSLRGMGGLVSKGYVNVNAMLVNFPLKNLDSMAARSDVTYITPDRPTVVTGVGHVEATAGADQARSYGSSLLNGSGIGIAVLDSGVHPTHHAMRDQALQSRVVASVDFTGEGRTDDPFGHGTHVASLAGGNSQISSGAYTGIAPNANIISVRVLNSQGTGSSSALISGIDWCISNQSLYNIRVMNISLGTHAVDSYVDDPLCLAVRRAFNAGIVVCVAAGNLGKDELGNKLYGTIHSPGIEPSAITVGAANAKGTNVRSDDGVATYSSRGPTRGYYTDTSGVKHYDNLIKPDLIAPGNKLIAAKSPNNRIAVANPLLNVDLTVEANRQMMKMSGTSMSTPVVSGAAALILQRNPALTPNLVKAVLEYTAQPIAGYDTLEQGAGLLNIEGAVRLAGSITQNLSNLTVGAPLLVTAHPLETTTIGGATFAWGGGIIQKFNFLTGSNLFNHYQGIYRSGVLLTDGTVFSNGVLLCDGTLISNGVLLSDGVLRSDGTVLGSGTLISDGVLLCDGVLLADGALISDGTLISDNVLQGSPSAFYALSVPATGDEGDCMEAVPDDEELP